MLNNSMLSLRSVGGGQIGDEAGGGYVRYSAAEQDDAQHPIGVGYEAEDGPCFPVSRPGLEFQTKTAHGHEGRFGGGKKESEAQEEGQQAQKW